MFFQFFSFCSVLFFVRGLSPRGFDILHVCIDGKQMLTLNRFTSSRRPRRERVVALDCICVESAPSSTHTHTLSSGPVPPLWLNPGVFPSPLSLSLSPSIALRFRRVGKVAGGFLYPPFARFFVCLHSLFCLRHVCACIKSQRACLFQVAVLGSLTAMRSRRIRSVDHCGGAHEVPLFLLLLLLLSFLAAPREPWGSAYVCAGASLIIVSVRTSAPAGSQQAPRCSIARN